MICHAMPQTGDRLLATGGEIAMSEGKQKGASRFAGLSEDWLAVIIGLGLVILVWIGAITNIPWPLLGLWK
jgi:hypothetical protein